MIIDITYNRIEIGGILCKLYHVNILLNYIFGIDFKTL